MNNQKKKRTSILLLVLVALLFVAYKVMFAPAGIDPYASDQSSLEGERVLGILQQIEKISFDVSVISDPKFKSLKSLEIPLPSLPVGKKNPFAAASAN